MSSSRVIIITGSSRGIGEAVSKKLALDHKCKVVITGRSKESLSEVKNYIESKGGAVHQVVGDICKKEVCKQLVEDTINKFGRIDSVVLNAGIIDPIKPIGEYTEKDMDGFEQLYNVNVFSVQRLVWLTLQHIRNSKGTYIFVSSGAAVRGMHGFSAYASSKGALNQLCRCVAVEEGKNGVKALSFRPGVVDSKMQEDIRNAKDSMAEEDHTKFSNLHKEGNLLNPDIPSKYISVLSLGFPDEWNGEFVSYDDEKIEKYVQQQLKQ